MPSAGTAIVLAAPDRETAGYVRAVLERSALEVAALIDDRRGWSTRAREAIRARRNAVVLLVPSAKLGRDQLELISETVDGGGTVLVWRAADRDLGDDDWLIERLLEQRGALSSDRLGALAAAIRLLPFAEAIRSSGVRVAGGRGALRGRLEAELRRAGARLSSRSSRSACPLRTADGGTIRVGSGKRSTTVPEGIADVAAALVLLCRPDRLAQADPAPEMDEEVIDLIARPPKRVLSETTSKRLAAAWGLCSGPESLCRSPTGAARFAGELEGTAVMKLVRPGLDRKAEVGAVVPGVEGRAAARRAYHRLITLAEELGAPRPLGVLIAAEIQGGARIWTRSADRGELGRVLLIGSGDAAGGPPVAALAPPVRMPGALRALEDAGLADDERLRAKLAEALVRLAAMVDHLGERIQRVEIDPLVAIEKAPRALMLDAVVEISGAG
ncbi:MAG: acetate--CoA ligase family protein [Polyangia bacterium]